MSRLLLVQLVAMGIVVVASQVYADERPFKIHPPNAETFADDMQIVEGEIRKTTALVTRRLLLADGTMRDQTMLETVAVPTPARRWLLGATGWHDSEGLTLETIEPNGPLARVEEQDGDSQKRVALQTQDVIATVAGRPVLDAFTLYHALQTTDDGDARIEWIDAATGARRRGSVRLAKVGASER